MTKQETEALAEVLRKFRQRVDNAPGTSAELASFCYDHAPRYNRVEWWKILEKQ